jgi:hypothetical protein
MTEHQALIGCIPPAFMAATIGVVIHVTHMKRLRPLFIIPAIWSDYFIFCYAQAMLQAHPDIPGSSRAAIIAVVISFPVVLVIGFYAISDVFIRERQGVEEAKGDDEQM